MLRRIRYRWVLPVANLLLYVVLIWNPDRSLVKMGLLYEDVDLTHAAYDGGFYPVQIDRAIPYGKVLAAAINFPAVLFAFPFGELQQGWRAELVVDAMTAIYLLPLWYVVGRWFDFRSAAKVRHGHVLVMLRRTILVLASASGFGILTVLILRLTQRSGEWSAFLLCLPALFWPVFLAYVARWELRAAKANPIEVSAG